MKNLLSPLAPVVSAIILVALGHDRRLERIPHTTAAAE